MGDTENCVSFMHVFLSVCKDYSCDGMLRRALINAWYNTGSTVVNKKAGTWTKNAKEIYNADTVNHMQPGDCLIYPRQRYPPVTAMPAAAAAAAAADLRASERCGTRQ